MDREHSVSWDQWAASVKKALDDADELDRLNATLRQMTADLEPSNEEGS